MIYIYIYIYMIYLYKANDSLRLMINLISCFRLDFIFIISVNFHYYNRLIKGSLTYQKLHSKRQSDV